MRTILAFVYTAFALFAPAPVASALSIGDVAPPVVVTDWIQGKPMDIIADNKGKVIMLEFWATWCGPCIQIMPETNELYQDYKDEGLVVVAHTDAGQAQQLSTVQQFVSQQGPRMSYPVAYDRTEKAFAEYVVGTGSMGIPYAVVIDKAGKIAWFGHPGLPDMKLVIRDLLLDRYDPAAAEAQRAQQARLAPLFNDFNLAVQRGDWEKCLSVTSAMLDIDPANFDALRFTVAILMQELNSLQRLRDWASEYINKRGDNAEAMAKLAALMLAMPELTDRQPDLAAKAAEASYKAPSRTSDSMQAVAQVYFEIGDVATAIRVQKEAVEAANKLDQRRAKEVLKFYETCKSLQAKGEE
jgi:thiol-disulfide isomerase/thioredoxin